MSRGVLFLDCETYSATSLRYSRVHRYAEDPEAAVTLCAWAWDGDAVTCLEEPWTRDGERRQWESMLMLLEDPGVTKVAHNATFDRVMLSLYTHGRGTGWYLDPAQWVDTMAWAAQLALPRGLNDLAKHLGLETKDSAGPSLIRRFAVPHPATKTRPAGRIRGEQDPKRWHDFRRYAIQDVEVLRSVYWTLKGMRDALPDQEALEAEERVRIASDRINDVGMPLNVPLAAALSSADRRNAEEGLERIRALTGGVNGRAPAQLREWISLRLPAPVPDVSRKTLDGLVADPATPAEVAEVARLRIDAGRAAGAKAEAALKMVGADDRVRDAFAYHGAHTGRWAGRNFQPQNLPREALDRGLEGEDLILRETLGEPVSPKEVAGGIRRCIQGPLAVVDYASIEAVVLAWLAGERWVLDAYHEGRDLYVETARRMSAVVGREMTRQEGKTALLGCGYGAGPVGLRAVAGPGPSEDELAQQVSSWRAANPNIVALWERLGHEMRHGGRTIQAPERGVRRMVLPSGRAVTYRGVHATQDRWGRPSVAYVDYGNRGQVVETFGGRLTENLVQAVARDILANALVNALDEGLEVVGHIHDEMLVLLEPGAWDPDLRLPTPEGVAAFRRVKEVMARMPSWADGIHVRAEGGVVSEYHKLEDWEEIHD